MPVTVEGAWKRYGPVPALRGASLRLEAGRVLGLLGPNGAGKTTLIKSIVGLVRLDRGTVEIDGLPPSRPGARRLAAYSPEDPQAPGWARVCELLERLPWLEGASLAEARRLARDAARRMGLLDQCERPLAALSRGQRKRALLAQALAAPGRRYYLFDEPFTGLDPEWVAEARSLVAELARGGAGVLVSSHLIREIEELVTEIAVILGGRTLFQGPPGLLVERYGGAPVLVARVSSPGRALEALRGLGLEAREEAPGVVRAVLRGASPEEALEALEGAGAGVLGYEVRGPSLEEAYLELVRRAREAWRR